MFDGPYPLLRLSLVASFPEARAEARPQMRGKARGDSRDSKMSALSET